MASSNGFHVNKPVELGLLPATRDLLARPVREEIEPMYLENVEQIIGPTEFLRKNTSTTEFENAASIVERAQKIDPKIDFASMHTILSHMVKRGEFESLKEIGCKTKYRRIENAKASNER